MKPRSAPSSRPVTREPIDSAIGDGTPFFACSFSISGEMIVANPSTFARIQPGRSTTKMGAVRSSATRPVNSRTSGVDLSAPARSSATTASAADLEIVGPGPAIFVAAVTARSQSIIVEGVAMVSTLRARRARATGQRGGDLVDQHLCGKGVAHFYPVRDGDEAQLGPVQISDHTRQAVHSGQGPSLGPYPAQSGLVTFIEPIGQRPGEPRHRKVDDDRTEVRVVVARGEPDPVSYTHLRAHE